MATQLPADERGVEPAGDGDRLARPYTPADFRLRLDREPGEVRPESSGWSLSDRPLISTTPPVAPAGDSDEPPPSPSPQAKETSFAPLQWEQVVARTAATQAEELAGLIAQAEAEEPARGTAIIEALAAVPDAPETPAVVPDIVTADVDVATGRPATDSFTPALPEGLVLPTLGTVTVTPPVSRIQRPAALPVAPAPAVTLRRRKRLLPRGLSFLLFVALVAGGAFGISRYLLAGPEWDAQTRPLADEVADVRGVQFRSPVPVEEVAVTAYVAQIADTVLPADAAARSATLAEWRAFGLLGDDADLVAAGRLAAVDMPAYYDPARRVIVVAAGLDATLRSFAVERALTWALLDQRDRWSDEWAVAGPGDAAALRAAVDAEALAVARASLDTPTEQRALVSGLEAWSAQLLGTGDARPTWLSAWIGRPGAPEAALVESLPNDKRRAVVVTRPSPTARGATFWYHVLAARLDPVRAWRAAMAWADDATVSETTGGVRCSTATIVASDPEGAARLLDAFTAWAAAAPAAAEASVTAAGELDVRVRACDPGAVAARSPGADVVPFGGASVEALAVARVEADSGPLADADRACIAAGVRSSLTRLGVDDLAPVVPPTDGWDPPALASVDMLAVTVGCGLA